MKFIKYFFSLLLTGVLVQMSYAQQNGINIAGLSIFQGVPSTLEKLITHEDISDEYRSDYDIWAVNGVVAGDIALADVDEWADFVFDETYALSSIVNVEKFIEENGHLPGIPSEKELIEKGYYSMHEMNKKFMVKIEELTLYTIMQEKMITALSEKLQEHENLKVELEEIKSLLRHQMMSND